MIEADEEYFEHEVPDGPPVRVVSGDGRRIYYWPVDDILLFFVMPLIAFCGVVAAKGRKGQTAKDQSERVSESDLHRT